jgi:hypothetical protein
MELGAVDAHERYSVSKRNSIVAAPMGGATDEYTIIRRRVRDDRCEVQESESGCSVFGAVQPLFENHQ